MARKNKKMASRSKKVHHRTHKTGKSRTHHATSRHAHPKRKPKAHAKRHHAPRHSKPSHPKKHAHTARPGTELLAEFHEIRRRAGRL